jgi:hypothetical protein
MGKKETEEEAKIPIDYLISYAGGNFCLFIGISVLSLIEMFEMVFLIIYIKFKRYMQEKNKKIKK